MGRIILTGHDTAPTEESSVDASSIHVDGDPRQRVQLRGLQDNGDLIFNEPSKAPSPEAPSMSLMIDPNRVKQLPEELREYNCSSCDRRQAGWAFKPSNKGADPDPIPICSLCWLYLSPWGRARVREVPEFIARFEKATNAAFQKDSGNQLVDHREADKVIEQLLRATAAVLRMQQMSDRFGGTRG